LKIYSPEESTGKIEIIDGKGMCPGGKCSPFQRTKVLNNTYFAYVAENMKGNLQYADFLDKYDQDSLMEKYVYFTE
jgi:hypothetical protein